MKVLVTGGTGFVGTHLVNTMLRRGHTVTILARDPRKTRNRYNGPVEAALGDVLDRASIERAAPGHDAAVIKQQHCCHTGHAEHPYRRG